MYVPPAFAITDEPELQHFVDDVAVAHLVTVRNGVPVATVLPMLVDLEAGTARAHFARVNSHWKSIEPNGAALAIFAGADAYVSPSWYPSKVEHGKVVPTWNYEAVHLTGTLTIHDDPTWLLAMVSDLSDRHEAGRSQPWSVNDAPASYIDSLLKAIVGVELTIATVEGKRKASQNRPEPDRLAVKAAMSTGTPREQAVAANM
jgi:transcriptional regulator